MRKYDVCIIGGAGHIGLPLGISFASEGKKVVLQDINKQQLDKINRGEMPFLEEGAEPLLKKVINKTLFVSESKEVIKESQFIVIVIGTPVDEHLNPKFNLLIQLIDDISEYLDNEQIIILRSTIYPGTTKKVKIHIQENRKKTKVVFCPERIAEGHAIEELKSLPQIIAADNENCRIEVSELFSCLTKEQVFLEPIEAELAKLFTNSWRYIQFAVANQFYQIAHEHRCDFYKIHEAITYNYPRARNLPRAGFAAGPCLFKDTMQLAAFSDNNFFLGHSAMLVNEGFPNYIVKYLKKNWPMSCKKVGILGMAFKANNDDKRESLSYKLKKILEIEADKVICSDVYIQDPGFVSTEELLEKSDIVILGVPHKEYKHLKFRFRQVVVDVWKFFSYE